MNLDSIGKLLTKITINYPRFRKDISTQDGSRIRKDVAEEWMRHIGYLSFDEALERLDLYMLGETGNRPPKPIDLRKCRPTRSEEWHSPEHHSWHLEFTKWDTSQRHGRLYDQEGREYVHDPTYEDGYHYNQEGRICTIDGKVVH